MITTTQSRDLIDFLAGEFGASIVLPTGVPAVAVRAILAALAAMSPVIKEVSDELAIKTYGISVTIPGPDGAVIVLSPESLSTPLDYVVTACHEMTHAVQLHKAGMVAGTIDYLGSSELRARAEADAYSTGAFAAFLLTGILPALDGILVNLKTGLYLLGDADLALASGVIRSHLLSMGSGCCPNLTVCKETLGWLQDNHPELIVPEVFHAVKV